MSELPSWNELKRLIAGPKPPVRARIVESSPTQLREAWVLHDGRDGWHITEGANTELSSSDSTTIVDSDRFETIRGMGVASNNWVKSLIQGHLIAYLDESTGQVIDAALVEGRHCWVADVNGLRRDEPSTTFRVWVDTDTGIILREERTDAEAMVEVRDIELGEVIEETPPLH
jgi:hypothetical protein